MLKKRKKFVEKLITSFGVIKNEVFEFELIESYFKKRKKADAFHIISDKTFNDLDFQELFMFIDRTNSRVGQQYLYSKLRTIPKSMEDVIANESLINEFTTNQNFRVSIQVQLSKLNDSEAFYISSLFQDEHIQPPKWYFLVKPLSFLSILSMAMLFVNANVLFILFAVFTVNCIIHFWNKKNLYHYFGSIPQIIVLNNVARNLFKNNLLKNIHPDIEKSLNVIDKIKAQISVFNLEARLQADFQALIWLLFELLKIFFLIEPLVLFRALKKIETKRNDIENVFLFVGKIDLIISIASLRKGLSTYCIPTITKDSYIIDADEAYHPLINDCVKNTIHIDKKSVLLTGSNMSGKTSFIRTIGINVVSGLTLNTCFAKCFLMPKLKVFSAIRITDDLMNDKSYYFEEVLTIKEMIHESYNGNSLFLLDEIFKGTNTVERISAGKAVLSALEKNDNIVFVSTHDIELADLLKEEYDLYHFSEVVGDKTVDFDYQLKSGKLKNRNAIRILQINGYPDSIIKEAITISKELCPEK